MTRGRERRLPEDPVPVRVRGGSPGQIAPAFLGVQRARSPFYWAAFGDRFIGLSNPDWKEAPFKESGVHSPRRRRIRLGCVRWSLEDVAGGREKEAFPQPRVPAWGSGRLLAAVRHLALALQSPLVALHAGGDAGGRGASGSPPRLRPRGQSVNSRPSQRCLDVV